MAMAAPPAPTKDIGLASRTEQLYERLVKVHAGLSAMIDKLLGPTPAIAEDRSCEPGNVINNIDLAHSLISKIENELDRLEHGL